MSPLENVLYDEEVDFPLIQWRDCKTVTIIDFVGGSAVELCLRTVNERSCYKDNEFVQPKIIQDFNSKMLGVN